jgi:hypothetical protein
MPGYYVNWNGKKPDLKSKGNIVDHDLISKKLGNERPVIQSEFKEKSNYISKKVSQNKFQLKKNTAQNEFVNQEKNSVIHFKFKKQESTLYSSIDENNHKEKPKTRKKVGIISIIGLTFGIIGSFIFPVFLGILAMAFGITGMIMSIVNKEKFGHIGIPIFTICLGIFDILLPFLLITSLTAFIIILIISLIFLVLIR